MEKGRCARFGGLLQIGHRLALSVGIVLAFGAETLAHPAYQPGASGTVSKKMLKAPAPKPSVYEGDHIPVGVVLSLTGRFASSAGRMKRGYDLAVEHINAQGGVTIGNRKRPLKLIYRNDASDALQAKRLAHELVHKEGLRFFLGPFSSGLVTDVGEIMQRHKTPMVQAGGAANSLYCGVHVWTQDKRHTSTGREPCDPNTYAGKKIPYVFGLPSTSDHYFKGAIEMALQALSDEGRAPTDLQVALALQGNNAFSREVEASIRQDALQRGYEISFVHDLPRFTSSYLESSPGALENVNALIKKLCGEKEAEGCSHSLAATAQGKQRILLVFGYDQGARMTLRALQANDVSLDMVALTHCQSAGVESLATGAGEYALCQSQWNGFNDVEGRQASKDFRDRWFGSSVAFVVEHELRYDSTPSYQEAQAAGAVVVLADAMERAGVLKPKEVRDALARTRTTTLFGPVTFDAVGRNVAKPMVLHQIIGGRYRLVWPNKYARAKAVFPAPLWSER